MSNHEFNDAYNDGHCAVCGKEWHLHDAMTTDNTPAPADSRSDGDLELQHIYRKVGNCNLVLMGHEITEGDSCMTYGQFEAAIRRRELESRLTEVKHLMPDGDGLIAGILQTRVLELQAELDKLTEGRGE